MPIIIISIRYSIWYFNTKINNLRANVSLWYRKLIKNVSNTYVPEKFYAMTHLWCQMLKSLLGFRW